MEKTIDQMNEAIGVFMGYKMYNKRYPHNHGIGAPEMDPERCMIIQKAKYHSSWDWLHEIWDKLRNTLEDEEGEYPPEFHGMSDVWELACFNGDIKSAHNLIYDAIQWYNKQADIIFKKYHNTTDVLRSAALEQEEKEPVPQHGTMTTASGEDIGVWVKEEIKPSKGWSGKVHTVNSMGILNERSGAWHPGWEIMDATQDEYVSEWLDEEAEKEGKP